MNITVYLPDDLARDVAAQGRDNFNVSAVCQRALRAELGGREYGPDAARSALADARLALDRAEAAIAEPMVTPDDVGMEMAGAYQKLRRAMSDRLDGVEDGPLFATLLEVWHHVAAVCRKIDPKGAPPLVVTAEDLERSSGSGPRLVTADDGRVYLVSDAQIPPGGGSISIGGASVRWPPMRAHEEGEAQ